MNASTPLAEAQSPTNAYLDALHEALTLGADAALAMLAPGNDAARDPTVLVEMASAAALLGRHTDHAEDPKVAALLSALATEPGRAALHDILGGAPLPVLSLELEPEERIETLRQLVELGALHGFLAGDVQEALAAHLDDVDAHVLGHMADYESLGEAAELLRNVAAFDADHPVSALLATIREAELAPLFAPTAAEAMAIIAQAVPPVTAEAALYAGWVRATAAWLKKLGRGLAELAHIPAVPQAVAFAATDDGAPAPRVILEANDTSEVNLVFVGGAVYLEWQGASEAPTEAEMEAQTLLGEATPEHVGDGDTRVRWRLKAAPGESGTRVVLRFPSGAHQVLAFPALDGASERDDG